MFALEAMSIAMTEVAMLPPNGAMIAAHTPSTGHARAAASPLPRKAAKQSRNIGCHSTTCGGPNRLDADYAFYTYIAS